MEARSIPAADVVQRLRDAGLRPPRTLTFAITGACNLHCRHCWVEGGITAAAGHVPLPQVLRVLREFAELGGQGLRLTGGEPLCHPDWAAALRCARELDFAHLYLQTNADLIGDAQAATLRDLDFPGLTIQISLDGAQAASHDLVRGTGAFAGALVGIRRLIAKGLAPRLSLFLTEMRHNLEEIPALLELAEGLGIPAVTTGGLVRCGRATDDDLVAPASIAQYLRLLDCFENDAEFRRRYLKIGKIAALEWRSTDRADLGGCAFVENPYITADGRLYPCLLCHADSHAVHGLFNHSLAAAFVQGAHLWATLLCISRARPSRIPACQACADRAACGAGCLGRAWAGSGDFFSTEDRCALRRAVYARQKKSPGAP
ncbi:radical SAM/SPASM domain-containing protein [Geoalkalibacter halelectricus]|uniref:radical SAM protein n=1 Tax=Geoalkalibacter halelectricus TaxID=2847045 RepID=UPI003D1C5A53